jgi:transcriptional regulator with XRE-family HTH domain
MARRRRGLTEALVARRLSQGLSQTEVAARMGTSQSAVARLESGAGDIRLSTLERYAAAIDQVLDWKLETPGDEER